MRLARRWSFCRDCVAVARVRFAASALRGGRLSRLAAVALAAGFLAACGPQAATAAEKPNLVIINVDDLGYADVSFQDPHTPWIQTPHIDALAHGGTIFTNGYVSAPICSPSRAGLLSGRQGSRYGYYDNYPGPDYGLPTAKSFYRAVDAPGGEVTIADRLKAAGYVTGALGKWDIGGKPGQKPWERGFDYYYGFYNGHAHPYYDTNSGPEMWEFKNGTASAAPAPFVNDYSTDEFAKRTNAFITANKDKPFFIYLAFNAVHTATQGGKVAVYPRPDILAEVKAAHPQLNEKEANMAAVIISTDQAVGSVIDTLKNTRGANGEPLFDNTIVTFISDNGGQTAWGSYNTPLRAAKATLWEGGTRVPYVISGGKKTGVKSGVVNDDAIVTSLDLFPTYVAAAGGAMLTDRAYDGVNLMPYLTGEKTGSPHETLAWLSPALDGSQLATNAAAIRIGDWKLVQYANKGSAPPRAPSAEAPRNRGPRNRAGRNNAGQAPAQRGRTTSPPGSESLFNVAADVGEKNDLKSGNPAKYLELLNQLVAYQARCAKSAYISQADAASPSQKFLLEYNSKGGDFSDLNAWKSVDEDNRVFTMTVNDPHPNNTLRFLEGDYTVVNNVRRVAGMAHYLNVLELADAGSQSGTVTLQGEPLMFVRNQGKADPQIAGLATGSGVTFNVEVDLILFADLELTGDGTQTFNLNGQISDYSAIGQANGLIKKGASTFTLGGKEPNTFQGLTQVEAGTLVLDKPAGVTALAGEVVVGTGKGKPGSAVLKAMKAGQVASPSKVRVESDGVFHVAGDQKVGAIEGHGTIELAGGTLHVRGDCALGAGGLTLRIDPRTAVPGTLLVVDGRLTGAVEVAAALPAGFRLEQTAQRVELVRDTALALSEAAAH